MIKPDIILTQPTDIDSPYFRNHIRHNRDLYNEIYICFSEHYFGETKYMSFIQDSMHRDRVTFFLPQPCNHGIEDWRNIAVKKCLEHSKAEYVLFLEQDFIIRNNSFLSSVLNTNPEVLGFIEDSTKRIHPAFFLVQRSILNKTSCNFAAQPPDWDHFGAVGDELKLSTKVTTLEDLGFNNPIDWEHISGLTYNYCLLMRNQDTQVQHKRESFIKYNKDCLKLRIEQHPEFLKLMSKAAFL